MERDYSSGTKSDVTFFVGTEIEHTPAYGLKTLFVVGTPPVDQILDHYYSAKCEHVYLGANQSFEFPFIDNRIETMEKWNTVTKALLEKNILVTLDFDLDYLEYVQSTNFCEYDNFIPQISIKIPNIKKLNHNATLKIDDIDFKATNPGVWCHRLENLQSTDTFTTWDKYGKDETL
jgi:hypothetical protein